MNKMKVLLENFQAGTAIFNDRKEVYDDPKEGKKIKLPQG